MAERTAFAFPGQGSQICGMGRELATAFKECREVFGAADEALGFPLSDLCFEGSDRDLALTENAQPAILTVSVAAFRALESGGVRPSLVLGHSLGEWSALVAAGSLGFADAVALVRKRGRYMQAAVPVGEGAMAAILGLSPAALEEICVEAAHGEVVVVANYNSPGQTVIAGHADAVRRTIALAEARGARRAVMLPVSAPFHSPLMESARLRLAEDLRGTNFAELGVPLVSSADASRVWKAEEARDALVRQVTAPVRFADSIRALVTEGITAVVEVGPGRVLSGLIRRTEKSLSVYHVEDPQSLAKTLAALGGMS